MPGSSNKNWTDPKVIVERTYPASAVVKGYQPGWDPEAPGNGNLMDTVSAVQIDGTAFPIVMFNGVSLDHSQLSNLSLSCRGLVPELKMVIADWDAKIRTICIPGMRNKITVVLTMPIDGAYSKISVDFYAVAVREDDNDHLLIEGRWQCKAAESRLVKSWKNDAGKFPTTYEFFKALAAESGIGFSAAPGCDDVEDRRIRAARSQNIKDLVYQHASFAGTGPMSVMDAWIDLYGYITMVNIPKLMSSKVEPNDLVSHWITAVRPEDAKDFGTENRTYTEDLPRMITNDITMGATHNMRIQSYKTSVDNRCIISSGTSLTCYALSPSDSGGFDSISESDFMITENSVSGASQTNEDYKFDRIEFMGCEYAGENEGCADVLLQERLHSIALAKLRSRILEVSLLRPNMALMRGMLLNVQIYEYDTYNKMRIVQGDALLSGADLDKLPKAQDITSDPVGTLTDSRIGALNTSLSGMYYIDGTDFTYSGTTHQIVQKLFLIKKDPIRNYLDSIVDKAKR